MIDKSIYKSIETTKNGSQIPILQNGKSIESKYNPENESKTYTLNINKENIFFIVIGIGGCYLINSILEKSPNAIIIGIENSLEDLEFLSSLKLYKQLKLNKNVFFCTKNNFSKTFIEKYIPVFYGNINIIEHKAWCLENKNEYIEISHIIQNSIKTISMDFSVQAHFGKIWNNNILNNLKISEQIKNPENILENINIKKTAVVIAAGPSLDSKIEEIKNNRNNYYIISTDTSFSILNKNEIKSDVVISIDGQQISTNHFINNKIDNTLFIFDLCANNSAVQSVLNKNGNIIFSYNNHPLSNLVSQKFKTNFINLNTGSGTVTIAALDFAVKCGFEKIEIFGADFSYINGKPYAKSTYLEQLYESNSSKINTFEKQNVILMMRVPLIKINENKTTTNVLNSYKESAEMYLKSINCNYHKNNETYLITVTNPEKKIQYTNKTNFNFSNFIKEFINNKNKNTNINQINELNEYDISLFPLISWLKVFDNNNGANFNDLLNIAYKSLLRYN